MWIYVWCLCIFSPHSGVLLMCTWKTHRLILIYMQLPLWKNSYNAESWTHKNLPGGTNGRCCRHIIIILAKCDSNAVKRKLHVFAFLSFSLRPINFHPSSSPKHYAMASNKKTPFFLAMFAFERRWKCTKKKQAWCTFAMIYHS